MLLILLCRNPLCLGSRWEQDVTLSWYVAPLKILPSCLTVDVLNLIIVVYTEGRDGILGSVNFDFHCPTNANCSSLQMYLFQLWYLCPEIYILLYSKQQFAIDCYAACREFNFIRYKYLYCLQIVVPGLAVYVCEFVCL